MKKSVYFVWWLLHKQRYKEPSDMSLEELNEAYNDFLKFLNDKLD